MLEVETKSKLANCIKWVSGYTLQEIKLLSSQKQQLQSTLQQLNQPLLEANGGKLIAQTLVTALDKSSPPGDPFQATQFIKSSRYIASSDVTCEIAGSTC